MSAMVYEWGSGLRVNTKSGVSLNDKPDAKRVGKELDKLESKYGEYTPAMIVDTARSQRSAMHKAFEWDDEIAGERYREDQARMLVRALVVYEDLGGAEPEPIRAKVQVASREIGNSYKSIGIAMADAEDRTYVLQQALGQLVSWRRKWSALNKFADAHPAVNQIDEAIEKLQHLTAE